MVKLSERLAKIADCIRPGETMADIGTDHGLLPIYLYQKGICPRVVLCDINAGPLEKARGNILEQASGVEFDLRQGSGLEPLEPGECDTVVIAGMGSQLIVDILCADRRKTSSYGRFVLQPRNAAEKLRFWLQESGFQITDEHLVQEGRYICEIIEAEPPAWEKEGMIPEAGTGKPDGIMPVAGAAKTNARKIVPQVEGATESEPVAQVNEGGTPTEGALKTDVRKSAAGDEESEGWIPAEFGRDGGTDFEFSPRYFRKQDPLLPELIRQKFRIEQDILQELYEGGDPHAGRIREVRERQALLKELVQRTAWPAGFVLSLPRPRRRPGTEAGKGAEPMEKRQLLDALEIIAPTSLAEQWDCSGVQVDIGRPDVERILVALEITDAVLDEAEDLGVDYIVTHHPMFFQPLRSVTREEPAGRYLIRLVQAGISVFSAHTNFDSAPGGNNDYLAELLGLRDVGDLTADGPDGADKLVGRIGRFESALSFETALDWIKEVLGTEVRAAGNPQKIVQTVALCTGAGGDGVLGAYANHCDLWITGDVRYHEAQTACEKGLCVVDAGHYGTERFFAANLAPRLRKALNGRVSVFESRVNIDPFW